MSEFEVYLILKLDVIQIVLVVGAFILGFCVIMGPIIADCYGGDAKASQKFWLRLFKWVAVPAIVIACLMPNTKDLVLTKIIPHVVTENSIKALDKIPAKLLKATGLGLDKLQEWLAEDQKEKKK